MCLHYRFICMECVAIFSTKSSLDEDPFMSDLSLEVRVPLITTEYGENVSWPMPSCESMPAWNTVA